MTAADSTYQSAATSAALVETDIPARLDRLPWGRFQTHVVVALGITWILDGLEVTLVGAVAGALKASPVLRLSNTDVGFASSAYLAGAVLGAMFFGWLTDRLGRKRLFFMTLSVYLVATAATAISWNFWSLVLFRFLTGAGIGGEYTAINSTIQELVPARVRGWTDLAINGSFWVGAALGAVGSIVLLDPSILPADVGWRVAFAIGATLSMAILFMRTWLPESPRWLATHGRAAEAEAVVAAIEDRLRREGRGARHGARVGEAAYISNRRGAGKAGVGSRARRRPLAALRRGERMHRRALRSRAGAFWTGNGGAAKSSGKLRGAGARTAIP